jgi:RND superfamily putative drug exporter
MPPIDRMTRWLASLGRFCAAHARAIVSAWAVAVALASVGAARLPNLLFSGSGDIPDSMSMHVDELMRSEFTNAHAQLLVLALRSPGLDREPQEVPKLFDTLKDRWKEDPLVADVIVEADVPDKRLLPVPGTGHVAIVSLKAKNVREAEREIPRLRATAELLLRTAQARHPDLKWAITGRAALTYDLNRFNSEDTTKAELRALPLTLLILIFAFGSLVAAGLPLILGLASTTLTLGLVSWVAQSVVLSNLVQNVASMIGLALGIDYSLFLIHRYRREIRRLSSEQPTLPRARLQQMAIELAMSSAGAVVLYSGLTVLTGMGGLVATPLMETRSLGFGGCTVVAVAVLVALTLLPATLALLGPVLLEWPRALSRRLHEEGSQARWTKWADIVTRHPLVAAIGSLSMLLLLALPGLQTRFGFPEAQFLPEELEYARGMELLRTMDLKGLLSPIPVVLTDTSGRKALTPERVPALLAFSARLRHDPRVATVLGPVDLADDWPATRYLKLYSDVDVALAMAPQVRSSFISTDQRRILMQVIPSRDCTLEETKALARAIPARMGVPGMRIDVGGQPQYYNDFDVAVKAAYARSVGFVLIVTCVVLLLVFRAPIVAAKALLLNALSVLAGYGVVVYVFQLGHGSSWLGVTAPTEVVPLTIPLLIFCILFGLSMDYEVFLLSRVRAAFERTGDNTASVREALAETGSVITSAALIMVAVFGAFASARVVLVQMLGLGLAVAVFVDATLIRSLLGPALMQVAGRWNWWPQRVDSSR